MARNFLDNMKDVEAVLLDQIEAMNDEPYDGYSDEMFERMIKKADATCKLVEQYTAVNNLKLRVVEIADKTGGAYDKTLGITEDKLK